MEITAAAAALAAAVCAYLHTGNVNHDMCVCMWEMRERIDIVVDFIFHLLWAEESVLRKSKIMVMAKAEYECELAYARFTGKCLVWNAFDLKTSCVSTPQDYFYFPLVCITHRHQLSFSLFGIFAARLLKMALTYKWAKWKRKSQTIFSWTRFGVRDNWAGNQKEMRVKRHFFLNAGKQNWV